MRKIDFVITWLDSTDQKWIEDINKYSDDKVDESRYRDWGFLKYWFRSIETNAPWVNHIYLITYGHIPNWLDTSNPKLVIVNHKDYIDDQFLPTFNSCVLENNLMNIKGLSDMFVYFNDDMFVNDKVSEADFFKEGKPLDNLNPEKLYYYGKNSTKINYNCSKIISKNFNIRKSNHKVKGLLKALLSFPKRPLNGLVSSHMPTSFVKSTFYDVWSKEEKLLKDINKNKFRTDKDVSQWLFQYWQIASRNYLERNRNDVQYYTIKDDNINQICQDIIDSKHKIICLNDGEKTTNFENNKKIILSTLEKKYKNKSSFEK